MTAQIRYEIQELPHPYDEKMRKDGVKAMCLVRVTRSAAGTWIGQEPVAMFNYDSEARIFQEHVMAEGLDGKLVVVEPSYRELYESTQSLLARRAK